MRAKSAPQFKTGFEGLNFFQQRYARGGNQFTVEPPDQGICVGNGYVVEAVNDVLQHLQRVPGIGPAGQHGARTSSAGFRRNVNHAVDLNSFYGYAPAINRTTGVRGPVVTDPSCIYDAATQRFFVVVLTLETFPNGAFTHVNHFDIAVSQTSNPTGGWNIYRIDVTDDGIAQPERVQCVPVSRRLPAYRRGCERLLRHDQRVSVGRQRLQRRTDLRVLEGATRCGCRERDDAAHRHVRNGQRSQ